MNKIKVLVLLLPISCFSSFANEYRVLINNNIVNYEISDGNTEDFYLGKNCLDILNDGQSNGDGFYFIGENQNNKIEVYCDMTTSGGGWTLVTRLNTTDSNVRDWSNDFWTNSFGTGNLKSSNDYMSAYASLNNSFSDVLLEYNYDSGVLKAAYKNNNNSLNYYDSLNQSLSLTNLDYARFYTNNNESGNFFGSILSFQVQDTLDINYDRYRIFNNKTTKDAFNQTGNIGTLSDIGNLYGWYTEAGYPSIELENTHRSYLGTNKGGSHPVINDPLYETLLEPSVYYSTDIINIYIR